MGKLFLVNAFSINMLPPCGGGEACPEVSLHFLPLGEGDQARQVWSGPLPVGVTERVAAIGHADTARIISGILGEKIPPSRATVQIQKGDFLLVAQYAGPRLPEGATVLPAGAKITWWWVSGDPVVSGPKNAS